MGARDGTRSIGAAPANSTSRESLEKHSNPRTWSWSVVGVAAGSGDGHQVDSSTQPQRPVCLLRGTPADRTGQANQNAYIDSFNGRFHDECLNEHRFTSLAHARAVTAAWRREQRGAAEERPRRAGAAYPDG